MNSEDILCPTHWGFEPRQSYLRFLESLMKILLYNILLYGGKIVIINSDIFLLSILALNLQCMSRQKQASSMTGRNLTVKYSTSIIVILTIILRTFRHRFLYTHDANISYTTHIERFFNTFLAYCSCTLHCTLYF